MDKAVALPVTYLNAYHLLHTVGRSRTGEVAYRRGCEPARVRTGEVAILFAAAGGVGSTLIQLAKLAKVDVIGLCGRKYKLEWL